MSFLLRKYCSRDHTNTVVGRFDKDLCFVLREAQPDSTYQIYPAEEGKTFYNLSPNMAIEVHVDGSLVGRIEEKDIYFFFDIKDVPAEIRLKSVQKKKP